MLRNLFILLTAMFMGLVYYKFSISKSKDAQNMAFFMKITFWCYHLYWRSPGKSLFL